MFSQYNSMTCCRGYNFSGFPNNKVIVSDNRVSDFWCCEESTVPQMKVYLFYTCVENLDNNYQFTINGKTVAVKLGEKDFSEIIE